jgi:hypothetical protein
MCGGQRPDRAFIWRCRLADDEEKDGDEPGEAIPDERLALALLVADPTPTHHEMQAGRRGSARGERRRSPVEPGGGTPSPTLLSAAPGCGS